MKSTTTAPPRPGDPAAASSDGSRRYDPRRDPKVVALVVIVFGTLAIALAGVGSTPVVGGDDGGTVFPLQDFRDEGPDDVRLSLEANRTSIRPGQSVAFQATYENGTPAGHATLSVGGRTYRLDGEGRATVTFDGGGTYTATVRKEDTESVRYVADGQIVSVERYEIALSVSANETTVEAGDAVEFTVRRADTDASVAANVEFAGDTYSTDDSGRAVVRVLRAGTFEAVATREPTATRRYVSDPVTVSAARRTVHLAIASNRSAPRPGEQIRLTVFRTDTGEPVESNVTVGDRTLRTIDGEVTVGYDRAGLYELGATKAATESVSFDPVAQSLRIHRHAAPATLSANRTVVEPGDAVRFTAVRSDTGEALAGQLTVGDRTYWLDHRGEATIRFTEPGELRVAARRANTTTHRFPADELNVTVKRTEYRIESLEAPDSAVRNESATISATVENVGADGGTATVAYRFDGETVATERVVLGPGQSSTVRFDVPTGATPGSYGHGIDVRDDAGGAEIEILPDDDPDE